MRISTNSFAKKTVTESSNTFADKTISTGSGNFEKHEIELGSKAWGGENLTSGNPGSDNLEFGFAPGVGEAGGIAHFKNRIPYTPSH